MFRPRLSLSALALAAGLALPVQAQDASTVVATVNGTEITVGHMIVARASLPEQYQQLPNEVLFEGILEQLIRQTALAQSFEGDLPARAALSIENETRSLTAGEAVERILAKAVTPEAVEAAYQEQYADADPGKEYNASHILVETEDAAAAIVTDLENGADFAAVAREKSTGPSGPGGGSLGWFGAGMMVAPFEQAVMTLEVGQVSAPVQTQFGWHVIKLNDTRNKDIPTLDDVREEIENAVRQSAVEGAIETLMSASEVDKSGSEGIDPKVLQDLTLVD